MRVLVTGGAGFIGSHVAEAALAAGHEVFALDNLSTGRRSNVPAGVELLEVDLRERDAVHGALRRARPDWVSHHAAQSSVAVSVKDPLLDAQVNVVGGINLLDACVATNVQRLVFAGTGGALYGEVPEGQAADENTRPAPVSPYAITKLAFEGLLGVYRAHHALDSIILRYANVYGPRQDPHGEAGVVAIFLNRLLAGQPLRINARRTAGDEGCVRDYVFVADVARANLLALGGELPVRVMNVGTGEPVATLEIAQRLAELVHRPLEPEAGPPRAGDLERCVMDVSICRKLLGAPTPLSDGLRQTCDWFSQRAR